MNERQQGVELLPVALADLVAAVAWVVPVDLAVIEFVEPREPTQDIRVEPPEIELVACPSTNSGARPWLTMP